MALFLHFIVALYINDVYMMFTQRELEDLAIKKAIEFILEDPLAGEMWDGQFLEQLARAPINKLKVYVKQLKELPDWIDNNIDDSMWDFEFEKDEFLERCDEVKQMISKL
ncbi:contact-dependent growth inhibition system immunity protein [Enterococcus malodoratus]|uniref:contact-dependent growth inhibition system immunity protein n=1 Tax=Enterococcus malodoratus TaxID=71451 RepID=UPI003FD2542E